MNTLQQAIDFQFDRFVDDFFNRLEEVRAVYDATDLEIYRALDFKDIQEDWIEWCSEGKE